MSEHPELREALASVIWAHNAVAPLNATKVADALLAGPVGKLQAELAEAQRLIVSLQSALDAWEPMTTERIRREAIGASLQARATAWHGTKFPEDGAYKQLVKLSEEVGELARAYIGEHEGRPNRGDVIQEASQVVLVLLSFIGRRYPHFDLLEAVEVELSNAECALAAGESAVTGEDEVRLVPMMKVPADLWCNSCGDENVDCDHCGRRAVTGEAT